MSSTAQQITNVSLYVLPVVIGNIVPIVTLPVFTRLLSTEDFGAWALANAYSVVVAGVATVGLPTAYERNFFEYREGRRPSQLLSTLVAFASLAFLGSGLLTWLLREPVTEWLIGDARYQPLIVWSFWSTAVVGVKAYYMTYLRNSERAGAFSACMIAERLLAAILTLLLVAWARVGVIGLVVGQMVASLAVLIVMLVRFFRELPPAFNLRLLTDSLKLGVPLTPRILLGVVGNNFDKYLIGQVASLGGVGIYSIGQRVATIAFTYMTALQNVFGPQVYTRMFSRDPAAGASIGRYLTPFAYVSTVLAFLIALFSEEILTVLAPEAFHGAVPIVTILAVYYGILFFGKMPQIVFARKTYLISILAAMTTGLNVALAAAGIWFWGTVGAAWGVLVAGAVVTTVTFIVGQRCFRIDWESRKMLAMFGLFVGSAFLTIALRSLGVPYLVRAAAKLGAVGAFIWLGVGLGILTAQNAALARDLLFRGLGGRATPE